MIYLSSAEMPGNTISVAVDPFFTEGDFLLLLNLQGRSGAYDLSSAPLFIVVTYEALFAFAMVLIAFAALFIKRK